VGDRCAHALARRLALGDVVALHDDHIPPVDQPPDVDRERLEVDLDLREDVLQDGLRAPVDAALLVAGGLGPLNLRVH